MTNQEFISYAKFKVQQWLWRNADDMDGISTDIVARKRYSDDPHVFVKITPMRK